MKTNKLLSVVLTLCVLLAAFSLTALAADGETYPIAVAYCVEGDENGVVEEYAAENLQNAINEIAKTAAMFEATAVKMTLQADVTGVASTLTVPAGTEFTLDLAGHTLEGNNQGKDQAFLLVNGKLTLTDSVGTGKVCSTYTGTAGRVVSVVGGELTVAGGTITTEGMAKAGNAIYVSKGSTLSMTGGKVYADAKRGNYAIRIGGKDAIFTMTGGVAEADSSTTETYITAIDVSSTGTGTIGGDSVVRGPKALTTTSLTALTVTGGSFTGEVSAPKNSITGGTFTDVDVISLAGYVDETVYACEKQADGSYTVAKAEFTAVATITGADGVVTRYAAATEAFSALKGGDTLKLLADIGTAAEPLPYGIVVTDGDVNVNLNAKTLIIGYDAAAAAAAGVPGYAAGVGIVNGGSGTVTVSGNGTLDVSNYTGTDGIAVWARTGSITVQSGTFINKSNEEATVYVGTNDDSSPVLTIAGGTYKNIAEGNYKYDESRTPLTFNIYNGKTADALKISAGSFYGNNDPYLGDDQVKGSILATEKRTGVKKTTDGYKVAAGQGIQVLDANGGAKNFYTGASTSSTGKLAVALADAADGDTLILLKNISASSQLNVTKAITIDLGGCTLTNSYDGSGYSLLTRAAVTMKNGTYKSTKGSARGIGAVADFTLENATLSAAGLVGLGCSAPDATYTVKNSTVIGNYALANFVNNAKINIESSTITGSGVGIYHNGSNSGLKLTAADSTITAAEGKTNGIYVSGSTSTMTAAGAQQVTLTNCTVSGGTAVEVKYTDLTLTDCTVTATTETPSYTQDDNGAATTGFAVVSTDNTTGAATPAPKGKITIQGANGSYKGQVGLASLETVKTEYADFKDTTYAVSGGSFTKAVLPEYCAEGFVPAANADGTYGVKAAPVAKIGTVEYTTLAEAIAAANDGDTVTLLDNLDISTTGLTVAATKTVTLDLNGHALKAANTNTGNIKVLGKLTLCDSTDTAKNGTGTGKVWTDTPYIYNKQDKVLIAAMDGGTFTMESGLIDTASSIADNANDGQFAVSVQNENADATVIINGGHIKAGWYAVAGNGTDITYNGNITVNGGILESVADYAIYHPHTGTTTVNGGVIFGAAGGISLNRGKLIVNDGTITSKGTGTTGNWGDGTGNQQAAAINVNAKYETTAVEIKGGKITAEKDAILLTNGRNGTVAVSGGSFSSEIKPEYCAEGFVPAANADGTYGVKAAPVAKIGTVEYATLADAIAAAKDGDTVTLTADINTPETSYYIQKSLTIDLGGKTLTGSGYDGVFNIEGENAAVLIKNGKIVAVEQTGTAGKYTMAVWACAAGCEVTLEDLDVSQQITHTDDKQMDMIYTSKGTIIINSGRFESGTSAWTLNCKDSAYKAGTAKIIVNGGTFVGYDPRNNTAEGAGTSFVAPGVGINKDENGSFTAVPDMAAQLVDADGNSVAAYAGHYDAIAAAKDGEKVILLSDRKNFVTNTINANITIDLNGKTLSLGNNNPFFRTNGEVTIQNGTIDSNVACVIVNAYNKLTLKNVKITGVTGNNGKNLVNVCSNAEVTIDKDTVLTASGSNGAAVFIGQDADAKYTLNVYGKVIQESKSFAISGNGSYKGTTTINIYDGAEVKSASVAIYHPQAGVINVNGGLVEGYCAIGIKSGTLNINGGTVRGTADDHVLDDSNSTSGTIIYDGSAIVVDSRAAGYAGNVNINVTGGTVESCYSTAIREIGEQDKPNMTQLTKLNITGGSVLGASQELGNVTNDMLVRDISSSNVSVSGGTFNHAVPETYCADGFVPTKNEDGTYGVKESRYVASVGDAKYETLAEAIAAAAKGSTVTLLADTRENVTIDKALTLDLNGFTLNGGTVEAKPALTITARTVTIKDSSEAQTGTIMREDTAENSGVSSHYVIDIQGNAWVMFESGKVTNNSGTTAGKGASLVRIGDDRVAKQPGLVIKGGTFTQDNFIVIKVGRGYLTLNGGTLNSANSYAIENWFRATIKGGTVNGTAAAWTYSGGFNSTLTVEGGTINGDVESVSYDGSTGKKASVSITGGTVNGALGTYIYSNGLTATEDATKATIGITGGTFANDPTKYVVEGATVTKNSEGKFGVEKAYLAKVGNTSYYTMEEAFKAQTASGEPVVLLRDYTTRGTFNSGSSNRTVDLNGYTWTYTGTNVNDAAFEINYPDVTLTVKNGTVVSGSMVGLIPSAMGGTIKYDNSGLVLDGVTATANGNSGIETNGNNTNDTVTLKNSTLNVPNGFGIYFPSSGTLTLDNSTVNAKTMGVQVCAGSLSINEGSAVTVTGDAVPKAEDDGAIQDGAAISVVNRTGYKGLGTVTVSGGKFTAKEGNSAIKAYDWANKTESDFTADKGTVAVSGGTFSSEIKSEYCAEGFEPVANTDGTYTVGAKKAVEVWTGYTGTSVAAYATVAEAAANLGENKWIVITGDYTLTADFTIPADVRLDVADGAVLTVANGVTLTVAADAKRLAARTGAAIVNNGTILVCGTSYSNGYVMVQEGGTLDLGTLTVPEGCFLDNNGTNYFAAVATYSITYADGTTKQAGSLNNLSGAVRVTLLKNVTDFGRSFSSTDALADNFVFDLGGHTLSGKANASSQVMTIAAPMTVTNGTIVYASSNEHYGAIQTNDNVTFDASVTVDGGVGYALRTNGYGKTVVFNGTAVTNGEYAITGNGAESGGLVVDCSLVVGESANISAANGIAIYHPMLGTVSVTGGKISGHTGIEMCAGKLVVSGGEITSTGANHDETGSTDTIKDGAAISIINRNYPGGVPTLEVTGGIVKATGEGALAVKAYDYTADKVAEWTTAGEFVNISGGTFSSEIKSEYCAEGFEPVANTDGTYGVAEKARVGLSDNMMIIPRGLADGKYTMLILAAIDSLDYAEVGFKVMVYNDGKAVSDETMYSTTTVYTSVKDGAGKVWKPDDSELGDTKCKYLFASTMEIDVSDKDAFTLDAYVRVVPYATDYDGNVLVKNTFNIPITYFFN